ncbi:uncharacterized protein PG986_000153 [Apiospora aurea]|uniref:Uncharacterized protein n=1 Tax=Apiospora aurea TaxID=335848 RepID=A0ABR1QT70_9PEZI
MGRGSRAAGGGGSSRIREHAGGYGTAVPGSPGVQQQQQQQQHEQQEDEEQKHPDRFRHELPLNEAPSQLPDNQAPGRPTSGMATAVPARGVRENSQSRRQVFEMTGDEYHQ